jgi:transcriptional regulator with XRE-family HTH domain
MTENKTPKNRLKEQRELSRLSQSEVAKMLDISVATVSRHEGQNRGLTRPMVDAYAKLYKVSAAELFVDLPEEEGSADVG